MLILTIKTDEPEAELALYDENNRLVILNWQAHRELAETLHTKLNELLRTANKKLGDIEAIACYGGPGSYTGLRIGMSVANALGYSLNAPVCSETKNWPQDALMLLQSGKGTTLGSVEYDAPARTTVAKK